MLTLAFWHVSASATRSIGAGHTSSGACVSRTVTVKTHVEVLPAASVAVETTSVVPTGKIEPDAGDDTIETGPVVQLSEAVTVKKTGFDSHLSLTVSTV